MTTKVIFAFDQDTGGITNFFELDSAVKGKLDNTIYTLGGAFSLVDVTSDVRSLTISRGRSRLLDKIESATAGDPAGQPRQALRSADWRWWFIPLREQYRATEERQVTVNDRPVFTGLVDAWDIDCEINKDSTSRAVCAVGSSPLRRLISTPRRKQRKHQALRIQA